MIHEYRQTRYTPAAVPGGRLELRPPLRLAWAYPGGIGDPRVDHQGIQIHGWVRGKHALRCLDAAGKEVWRRSDALLGWTSLGQAVIGAVEKRGKYTLRWVSWADGEDLKAVPVSHSPLLVLDDREHFIGKRWLKDNTTALGLVDFNGRVVWERSATDLLGESGKFDANVAVGQGRGFIGCRDHLLALMLKDGALAWSVDLTKDHGGPHGGSLSTFKWIPMFAGGLVVINTGHGTAAFEAKTGDVAWTSRCRGARTIYDGRVYLIDDQHRYVVLDLKTGRVLKNVDVKRLMKSRLNGFTEVNSHIAVSETHVFMGDMGGHAWALDRETGRPVWHDKAPDAECFFSALPVVAGNRLYISSYAFEGKTSLYCYEQTGG